MVIEFDFEIYKNGDYDKVYLRNGKEARVLCDNGKGNSPMVVMIEDDKADDYIILRYNETGRRNINGQSGSRSYVIGKRTGTRIMGCCHILYG